MKGDVVRNVTEFDGKIVYVEFGFQSITICGSEEETDKYIGELQEEYQDGLFMVNGDSLTSVNNGEFGVHKYHNLIDSIYEWIE